MAEITEEQEKAIEERIERFQKTKPLGSPSTAELKALVMGEIRIHQFFEKDRTAEWSRGYQKGFSDGRALARDPGEVEG